MALPVPTNDPDPLTVPYDPDHLHYLGRLGKAWGHRGELGLGLEGADLEEVLALKVLFVELEGLRVPFFVASLRPHDRMGALVRFEEYGDPQRAAFLVNAPVFAPPGFSPSEETGHLRPEDLMGMLVEDEGHGVIGRVEGVEGVEGTAANPVLVVKDADHEVLIPLVDEYVIGIDPQAGLLTVRIPPGLAELNKPGSPRG